MLGPTELIFIFLAILLLFGAKRIPEIARGLGHGIREFKDATNDIKKELTVSDQRQQAQPPRYQAPPAQEPPPVAQSAPPPAAEGQAPTA